MGIYDSFDLLGHSWGGILAAELEVRRQPIGLRRSILSDSLASSALWGESTRALVQSMPQEVQEGIIGGMKDPAKHRGCPVCISRGVWMSFEDHSAGVH